MKVERALSVELSMQPVQLQHRAQQPSQLPPRLQAPVTIPHLRSVRNPNLHLANIQAHCTLATGNTARDGNDTSAVPTKLKIRKAQKVVVYYIRAERSSPSPPPPTQGTTQQTVSGKRGPQPLSSCFIHQKKEKREEETKNAL